MGVIEGTRRAEVLEHRALYRDEHAYCAHPHLAVSAAGSWLLVFNRTVGLRDSWAKIARGPEG